MDDSNDKVVHLVEKRLTLGNRSSAMSRTGRPIAGPPTTDKECAALQKWAESQSFAEHPATSEQIARHLEFLAATLPGRGIDEQSAKMRFAVYSRILSEYSNAALSFMSRIVCERFDWFPTPKQCLEVLSEYRKPTSEGEYALSQCHQYRQSRFEEWIDALRAGEISQGDVDNKPEQWRRIAVEQGFLRRLEDGSFVIRRAA